MDRFEIMFEETTYEVCPNTTVLDSLEAAGARIPASCRSGVCQSCLMQSIDVPPPASSQKGISIEKQKLGYFLACQCKPASSMRVRLADEAIPRFEVRVASMEKLSSDILQVRFDRPVGFEFLTGQYVNFHSDTGLVRSYSIASLPRERDFFDIHVRLIPAGEMSTWFFNECSPGERLRTTAPRGECCYFPESADEPLLLVGIGTGVAPLQAIARDALLNGRKETLYFYQAALTPDRLYLRDVLGRLSESSPNFRYEEVTLGESDGKSRTGNIVEVLMADFDKLKPCNAYLCGDAALVNAIRKKLFLAGIPMSRIKADAFLTAKDRNLR